MDLIDNTGRVLIHKEIDNDMCELNINGITAGNYFIRVSTGKNSYSEILVKF